VDYDLSRLGTRPFEHLSQALFQHFIGTATTVFGDGPDGGREATWEGAVSERSRLPTSWTGFGVLQAKYKERAFGPPMAQANWLISQLKAELDKWADPTSKRGRVPRYFLAATNVILSPGVDGGLDKVYEQIREHATRLGLAIEFEVWHYDSLRVLLDDAVEVRTTYAAWVTPGDVLARLLNAESEKDRDLMSALSAYLAKKLIEDSLLNLTQAGSVSDAGIRIEEVFIDLPVRPTNSRKTARPTDDAAAAIINVANAVAKASTRKTGDASLANVVLMGGPGQGKSTISQFLCQIYRAQLLAEHPAGTDSQVNAALKRVQGVLEATQLPTIGAKRWPISIKLTDFADSLAVGESRSVLEYIANHINARSGHDLRVEQVRRWLRLYPWIVFLDGLDEVPASSNRTQVIDMIREFLVDVASIEADVSLVVTTRPQGYSGEFDGTDFRQLTLAPLAVGKALAYAQKLLAIRVGVDSDRYRQSVARVQRATTDQSTLRLMSSPLQVTILTLLVERQGQAPRDRWRLFSHYYRVIYQREQENGGMLATLLSDHESDINAVHFRVGYTLQLRSEQAGDTESHLAVIR